MSRRIRGIKRNWVAEVVQGQGPGQQTKGKARRTIGNGQPSVLLLDVRLIQRVLFLLGRVALHVIVRVLRWLLGLLLVLGVTLLGREGPRREQRGTGGKQQRQTWSDESSSLSSSLAWRGEGDMFYCARGRTQA